MTLLKFMTVVVVLVICMSFLILHRNGANLFAEPGLAKRLGVFLTTHSASTSDNHFFDELRTPVFSSNKDELYQLMLKAATELGWGIIAHDKDKINANFVVSSPMFLFEDDVFVQVKAVGEKQASLSIQSSSRKGRADFAANSGHVQKLIMAIKDLHSK